MSLVNAPIHDLLIRIKNAYMARRHQVNGVVHSKFKTQVLDLLKKYRFIREYSIKEDGNKKFLNIDLYVTGNLNEDIPVVKFFSKPSRRWYVGWKEINSVAGGNEYELFLRVNDLWQVMKQRRKKLVVNGLQKYTR